MAIRARAIAAILTLATGCAATAYWDGNNKLHNGDYPGAIAKFNEVLQHDPQNFGAALNRGLAHEKLQQYDQALQDYDLALQIVPAFGMAYHYRGHVYAKRHDDERAIAEYDQALRCVDAVQIDVQGTLVTTDVAGVQYDRGNALSRLGRYQEAVESYDKALALSPGFADATRNRRIANDKLQGR
jgi:tetratricopeptide (TPR) repeat protein